MKNYDIRWQSFERSELPKALFGYAARDLHDFRLESALERGHGIALGYMEVEKSNSYAPPSIIILDDKAAAETLSWLKTFAQETSPLSQFARIMSYSDWAQFGPERLSRSRSRAREDRWACVVLGELIAQGESDIEVANLPLSWSASCFSTTIARSAILYATEDSTRICIERLIALENDQKFIHRQISIANLEPVWSIAFRSEEEVFALPKIVSIVLNSSNSANDSTKAEKFELSNFFAPQGKLMSDSVEDRVVAFQELASKFTKDVGDRIPTAVEQVVIAAGAFLVGRGTSHSFLLNRLPRRWASAYTWFGLMAGLAGPKSWDGAWSRAAKGIERFIRGKIDWGITSGADLSWTEYLWLTSTFSGKQIFAELPKILPKVLSIEVIPGATCQLRLTTDSGGGARDISRRDKAYIESNEGELRITLDQIAKLVFHARQLLLSQEQQRTSIQVSMEFENDERREHNTTGPQRNKRNR